MKTRLKNNYSGIEISSPEKEKLFADNIFDNSRSMITVINRDYTYEKANAAFCNELKDICDSVVGKSLGDVWGKEIFRENIKKNIDLCFSGQPVSYEASFRTPNSADKFYEVNFRPVRDENGEITHLVAETSDISARKLAEMEASEIRNEYNIKTRDYEDRLLQAQRLETIGSLAGGIAHDFNNILATISGYAEMLMEDLPAGSPSLEKTSKILSAVYKARSLTDQILAFSRRSESKSVPVVVNRILIETIELIRSSAPPEVTIETVIPDSEVTVNSDPTQIFRVFLNLMTNALQSMEKNGGTLTVGMEMIDADKVNNLINKNVVAEQYISVTIRDTGEGMDPSVLTRIFEPFYTTREVGKGTGLGLSVAHGIVTDMGGEILVSSLKEKGSLFLVYLPVNGRKFSNFADQNE